MGPLCALRDEILWTFRVAGDVEDVRVMRERRPVPSWDVLAKRCDSEFVMLKSVTDAREEAVLDGNICREVMGPS